MNEKLIKTPDPSLDGITILNRISKTPNVWHAYDNRDPLPRGTTTRDIVIKGPAIDAHPTAEDIIREAQIIDRVHDYYAQSIAKNSGQKHPRILHVHDVWERPNEAYLATPFIDAQTLVQSKLPKLTSNVIKYGTEMLDILALVHRAGYMHYDAKIDNWFNLSSWREPSLVLFDFSAARPKAEHLEGLLGTPGYMSPQVLMREHDPRADVFTVGVNLYLLLTNKYPFYERGEGFDYDKIGKYVANMKRTKANWNDLLLRNKMLPVSAKKTIESMITYESKDRPSLLEARNELAKSIDELPIEPMPRGSV